MKKLVSLLLLCMTTLAMYAQQKDVTKFLGIPVDGTKSAMIQKLKAKGFTYDETFDCLVGEFNGGQVFLSIETNKNRVYRIALCDIDGQSEGDIKIRFNNLCRQFENNAKYTSYNEDQTIPESEDISHKMRVENKRYEAIYLQNGDENKGVWFMIDRPDGLEYRILDRILGSEGYRILMFYDNVYNQANGEDL